MDKKGFTLIELLVVISIIGLLSTLAIVSLSDARKKSRNTKRVADLKQIQTALELYYEANKSYPATTTVSWRSECPSWGGHSADNVIPGLIPTYIASFPADPLMNKSISNCCYLYRSDGADYALLDHRCPGEIDYSSQPSLLDPNRDGGTSACNIDGSNFWAWKVSSDGGRCW